MPSKNFCALLAFHILIQLCASASAHEQHASTPQISPAPKQQDPYRQFVHLVVQQAQNKSLATPALEYFDQTPSNSQSLTPAQAHEALHDFSRIMPDICNTGPVAYHELFDATLKKLLDRQEMSRTPTNAQAPTEQAIATTIQQAQELALESWLARNQGVIRLDCATNTIYIGGKAWTPTSADEPDLDAYLASTWITRTGSTHSITMGLKSDGTLDTDLTVSILAGGTYGVNINSKGAGPTRIGSGSSDTFVYANALTITGTAGINTIGTSATTIGNATGKVGIGGVVGSNMLNVTGSVDVTAALGAGTTLTAGTGITATTGNITASSGNVVITAGNLTLPATTDTVGAITVGGNRFMHESKDSTNTFLGTNAGQLNPTNTVADNVGVGYQALTLMGNSGTTSKNTAVGSGTLAAVVSATDNTAVGYSALNKATGTGSTAVGSGALANVVAGTGDTAVGYNALNVATSNNNTALGYCAGAKISSGTPNTAIGYNAMSAGTVTGANNVAVGSQSLLSLTSGGYNVVIGDSAGAYIDSCSDNIAIGYAALNALAAPASGSSTTNIAIGYDSMLKVGGGGKKSYDNVAIGDNTLGSQSASTNTLNSCVAIGSQALKNVTEGDSHVAVGAYSAAAVTTASGNTAIGRNTLNKATSGNNTAVGYFALANLVGGTGDTAVGYQALTNATGANNTAVGYNASTALTSGTYNTAVGYSAMAGATVTGSDNIAVGYQSLNALTSGTYNVAIGDNAGVAIATGTYNTALGTTSTPAGAGSSWGSASTKNICINNAGANESSTIRIGNSTDQTACYVSGITGTTTGQSSAKAVAVDSNGQLGTAATTFNIATDGAATTVNLGNGSAAVGITGNTNTITGTTDVVGTTSINRSGSASTTIGSGSSSTFIYANSLTITGITGINSIGSSATTIGNATGKVGICGDVDSTAKLNVTGTSKFSDQVTISANGASITGTTGITGATTIVGTTLINDGSVANAGTSINTTSGSGTVAIGNSTTPSTVTILGTTTINDSGARATTIGVSGTGAVTLGNATGKVGICGAVDATAKLNVTGTSKFSDQVTISANGASITGTTGITGATTIVGTTLINDGSVANAGTSINTTSGSGTVAIGNSTTPSTVTILGTTTVNDSGARSTTIGVNGTGAVTLGNATGKVGIGGAVGSNMLNVTGSVDVTAALGAGTTLTAGTGITATTGNITASSGNVVITAGNLTLPATTATVGAITVGGNRFMHESKDSTNTFLGTNAGQLNPTNTVAGNVGVGYQALTLMGNSGTTSKNTAVGSGTLAAVVSATDNTAIGYQSLNLATGTGSTAVGSGALAKVVANTGDTAVGYQALTNATGSNNTAVGYNAAGALTSGASNTAVGYGAIGTGVVTGSYNTATGCNAGASLTSGTGNIALGYNALGAATITGSYNSVMGYNAGANLTSGAYSTTVGYNAMSAATVVGAGNVAVGSSSLRDIAGGQYNAVVGTDSFVQLSGVVGESGTANTAIGYNTGGGVTTGNYNIAVGYNAGSSWTAASNSNICIDAVGGSESNTIRIGNQGSGAKQQNLCYIAGITGATSSGGAAVFVNGDGKLGTDTSAMKYKENIQSIDGPCQKILQLRPIAFNYKADANKTTAYGLIAEEVEQIFPEMVVYNDGAPDNVRYHLLAPLMLRQIQIQNDKINRLTEQVHALKVHKKKHTVKKSVTSQQRKTKKGINS